VGRDPVRLRHGGQAEAGEGVGVCERRAGVDQVVRPDRVPAAPRRRNTLIKYIEMHFIELYPGDFPNSPCGRDTFRISCWERNLAWICAVLGGRGWGAQPPPLPKMLRSRDCPQHTGRPAAMSQLAL
jgi:hypothetical protein